MDPKLGAHTTSPEGDEVRDSTPAPEAPWLYRGTDLSRILALSDGIFAFAMTLLVLSLVIPVGSQGTAVRMYLLSSSFVRPLYAYVITFFVISLWWQGHHLIFSYIRTFSRNLIRLNTTFLVFIAVLPFATGVLNAAGNDPTGVAVFALLQVGAGVTLGGLWIHASGRGKLVRPHLPPGWNRYITIHTFTAPLFFGLSIPLAFLNTSAAEILWLGVFIAPLVTRPKQGF